LAQTSFEQLAPRRHSCAAKHTSTYTSQNIQCGRRSSTGHSTLDVVNTLFLLALTYAAIGHWDGTTRHNCARCNWAAGKKARAQTSNNR
jgi:hypothetical protein